ncbi:MAG: aspartate aminotransferase family protein [Chloroflexota bacterium]
MPQPPEANRERRERLYAQLVEEYKARFAKSAAFHANATARLIDGGSHGLRLFPPFPFWVNATRGSRVYDLDGHAILDFWQGHYSNILGHNPPVITEPLAEALREGRGLQSGMQDIWEWELADILCRQLGAERVRFTSSGTLSTMNAILLSRSYTGRTKVLKVGGGWHGGHPWGLKGVHYGPQGYQAVETEGLPSNLTQDVLITRFNDPEALEDTFRQQGDQIACFIVEPWLGSGGGIPATPEFLRTARDLTTRYGALLILDEVIAGFRFRAGNLGALYGIQPDLTTLGKVVGGGMPVAAVAGRADVLNLTTQKGRKVVFDGGTYSAHPLSMLAGRLMIEYLVRHEKEVYSQLADVGARFRQTAQRIFDEEGLLVRMTGEPIAVIPGSSLAYINFPYSSDLPLDRPEALNDPALSDIDLRDRVIKIAFLLEDVFTVHGAWALSTAHSDEDLAQVAEATRAVARRLRAAGCARL